jgi:hypothetical protein
MCLRRSLFCAALLGLFVFSVAADAQDSLNVRRRDEIAYAGTWHWAQDVALVGQRAYVARRQGGLAVEDISNLDALVHLADVNPPC